MISQQHYSVYRFRRKFAGLDSIMVGENVKFGISSKNAVNKAEKISIDNLMQNKTHKNKNIFEIIINA